MGLTSCLPPCLPTFQRTCGASAFAVRTGSLSPTGSAQIQVVGHDGGQVASSLPVTVSPSWKEAVGVDGLRPAQDRGHPLQHRPRAPRGTGLPVRGEVSPSIQSRPKQLLPRLFSDLRFWSRQETFSTVFSCPFPRQTVGCSGITSISCFLTAGTKTSSDGRTKNPKYSG